MKNIILLFLLLSLGSIFPISFSGSVYNVHFVEIGLIFMFLWFCIKSWKKGMAIELNKFNHLYYILLYSCILYSMLIYFWSDYGASVIVGSLSLIYGGMAYLIAQHTFASDVDQYPKAIRILNISLLIQLLINMATMTGDYVGFYAFKQESTTLLGGSNYISFFFAFGLLYEIIAKEKRWTLYTLINLTGVIFTLSRGAIMSLIVALAVYFIIVLFNKRMSKKGALLGLAIVTIGFFGFVNYTIAGMEFWMGLKNTSVGVSSASSRVMLWEDTIDQISDKPFGNGITWRDSPHNVGLTAWRDLGVIFGTIYIFLIAYPLFQFFNSKIFKRSNKSIALLIAYLSAFAHSMIEIFYFNSTSIIWTTVTLAYINKILNQEKQFDHEAIQNIEKPRKRKFKRYKLTWH